MPGKSVQCLLLIVTVFSSVCSAVDCISGPLELPDNGIIFAPVGGSVQLNCTSTDTPIAWYRNNIPISPGVGSRQSFTAEGNLLFQNLQVTQSGWYTCASNPTRVEEDFLLIVGEPPSVVDTSNTYTYSVIPGSRVELACPITTAGSTTPGVIWEDVSPPPDVIWRDGSGNQIFDGGPFSIDRTTGSLSIANYSQNEVDRGGYVCQVCNQFGSAETIASNITLTDTADLPFTYTSDLSTRETPVYIPPNNDTDVIIRCTGEGNMFNSANNITVQWYRDFEILAGKTNNRLKFQPNSDGGFDSSTSGYYCCNVKHMGVPISRHCITVWVGGFSGSQQIFPPTTITLPAGTGRRLHLGCLSIPLRYNEPVVTWKRDNQTIVNLPNTTLYGSDPVGLNYVSVSNVSRESGRTHNYTCRLGNFVTFEERSFAVTAVDLGTGVNIVQNGEASNSSDSASRWTSSNSNASLAFVHNENVFKLVYSGPGTTFTQTVPTPMTVSVVHVSGRIRQTSVAGPGVHRGQAALKVNAEGQNATYLFNPGSKSDAWQWVGELVEFSPPVDRVTIEMMVLPEPGQSASTLSGQAFFDDINVNVVAQTSVEASLAVVIGASVGGGVLIILLLLLILIVCCCCLCSRNKKKSGMMKKMSIKMAKRFSSKRDNTRYENDVALQSINQTNPPPIYEPVTNEGDYINPEDYQYVNANDHNPRAASKQSVTSNSDGQYTALDPTTLEDQNTYAIATPASHRSLASLHDPPEAEDGYVDVATGYLPVLPPTGLASSVPTHTEPEPEEDLYVNDPLRVRSATSPGELEPNVYESIKGPYR